MSLNPITSQSMQYPLLVSPQLEKVRFNILEKAGVIDKFSEREGQNVCHLISSYEGPDDNQELASTWLLKDAFNNPKCSTLLSSLIDQSQLIPRFIKEFPSSEWEKMVNTLSGNLCVKLQENPIGNISLVEVLGDSLKFLEFKTLFFDIAIKTATEYVEHFKYTERFTPNAMKFWLDRFVTNIQGELKKDLFSDVQKAYGGKSTLLKADRDHIAAWVRQVTMIQKACATLLKPIALQPGESQGLTFTIKNGNQLCGYLYGTMHQLNTVPYGDEILQISPKTQAELYECAILGTEIAVLDTAIPALSKNSVDGVLLKCASNRGIANMGIDHENRDYFASQYAEEQIPEELSSALEKIIPSQLGQEDEDPVELCKKMMARAYLQGDINSMKDIANVLDDCSPKTRLVNSLRNQEMADNIDALLKGCKQVEKDTQSRPILCFFAVGEHHLITQNDSLVELLRKKGWSVDIKI